MQRKSGPDPIDVAVGGRIRIRRRWLNFSQTQLAEHIGITFQQVQKYERGANRVSASMLVRIAAKLETTASALIGEAEVGESILPSDTFAKLATPGAVEVLEGYCAMNPEQRASVKSVVAAIRGITAVKAAAKAA